MDDDLGMPLFPIYMAQGGGGVEVSDMFVNGFVLEVPSFVCAIPANLSKCSHSPNKTLKNEFTTGQLQFWLNGNESYSPPLQSDSESSHGRPTWSHQQKLYERPAPQMWVYPSPFLLFLILLD